MIYGPDGQPVKATTPRKANKVRGMVHDAVYRPEQRSLLVTLKEVTSGKLSKPCQISASAFPFGHIDGAMQELARQLKLRKIPLVLAFDPDDQSGPNLNGYVVEESQ